MTDYLRTLDGEEHPVGKELPPIECFRCGVCCEHNRPPVTPQEIETIARNMGMTREAFVARYVRRIRGKEIDILQTHESKCPFLSWEEEPKRATCSIHPFKPEACVNWVASLSRRDCQEGLARLKPSGEIMFPPFPFDG